MHCCLCEKVGLETHQHIFVECSWFAILRNEMQIWTGYSIPPMIVTDTLNSIQRKHWKQFTKEIMAAVYGAMVYYTWRARNWKVFRGITIQTNYVYTQIQQEIKVRVDMLRSSKRAHRCSLLINRICS